MMITGEENLLMGTGRQKNKVTDSLFFLLFSTFFMLAPVHAADFEVSPDGSAVVRLVPQGTVTAGSLDTALLNSGWTATTGTGGALSVTSYNAGFKSGIGGGE